VFVNDLCKQLRVDEDVAFAVKLTKQAFVAETVLLQSL
jgi:hypothetical protein